MGVPVQMCTLFIARINFQKTTQDCFISQYIDQWLKESVIQWIRQMRGLKKITSAHASGALSLLSLLW